MRHLAANSELITFNVGANNALAVGDWSGLGAQSLALISGQVWSRYLNCDCTFSNTPSPINFNSGGGVPLAGKWRTR
jgi:hypothetical protein